MEALPDGAAGAVIAYAHRTDSGIRGEVYLGRGANQLIGWQTPQSERAQLSVCEHAGVPLFSVTCAGHPRTRHRRCIRPGLRLPPNAAPPDDWAIDSRRLDHHAKTGGYFAGAITRRHVTDTLGVAWHSVERGLADRDGVTRPMITTFSTRRAEINPLVDELGLESARVYDVRRTGSGDVPAWFGAVNGAREQLSPAARGRLTPHGGQPTRHG